MAILVKHLKTNAVVDWTQAELDAQIALGNFAPGTTLADIVLPSDWNDGHDLTGFGTMAEQDADDVAITGGTINGVSTATIAGGIFPSISTNRILGRTTAGTGAVEELTAGEGLNLASGSVSAKASIKNSGYNNSYWLGYGFVGTTLVSAQTANRVYYIPFVCGKKTTFTEMGTEVTAAVNPSTARLGIYRLENGIPTTLLLDAGDVNTSTNGNKTVAISYEMDEGFYCLALMPSAAVTLRQQSPSPAHLAHLLGVASMPTSNSVYRSFYEDMGSYALPSTATPIGQLLSNFQPQVYVR